MDYRLESEIWRGVQRTLTKNAFIALLAEAFCTYKRPLGYFQLDRIHPVDAG